MKSIHDKMEWASAAIQAKKSSTNVIVREHAFGNGRPTGCSWHRFGNLELWKSSSGECNVNGYAGCFCKILPGKFSAVYAQGDPGLGIGGYDLKSQADRAFAFDYDKSGKLDHIVLYRPGTGTMWILKNSGGKFSPVYAQGDPGRGIGGYDLKSQADRAFAFDYDKSGKLDHIVLYRPGTGTMW